VLKFLYVAMFSRMSSCVHIFLMQGPAGPHVEVEYEDDEEEPQRVPNAAAVAW